MKKTTTKEKSAKDLQELVIDNKKKLSEFRFHLTTGKMKNVREGRVLRKEIARALTALNAPAK